MARTLNSCCSIFSKTSRRLGLVALLLLLCGIAVPLASRRGAPGETVSTDGSSRERAARAAVKPPPPADDYVGSETCARCHDEIYASYAASPMYHSAGPVPGEHDLEVFDERAEFQPRGNRRYRVERASDQVLHHEIIVDAEGGVVHDESHPARLFIGSGTRGKTFAIMRGDRLYQSPISWFTSGGGRWDLSPGRWPRDSSGFERPIGDECTTCHVGRMAAVPDAEDSYREPWVLEAGIGCERCHGPAGRHVAWHADGALGRDGAPPRTAQDQDPIVNPARLDPARRESICNQCHLIGKLSLPRYGRSFRDFRPGQLLDDAWTVLVAGTGVRDDATTKAVSQVQQMRASACFQGSAGRLGCSSCHAAHSKPLASDTAEFYRNRCLECHAQRGCSLPEAVRAASPADNSCIHCHMPRLAANDIAHASQTDHRVRRTPGARLAAGSEGTAGAWEFFDHAQERLQSWEVDRVRGLALVALARESSLGSTAKGREAETLLLSASRAAPDDLLALRTLGYLAAANGRPAEGREYLERSLELAPRDVKTLQLLAAVCHQLDDLESMIRYSERLLMVNPWCTADHARLSAAYVKQGRLSEAIRESEAALELDFSLTKERARLVQLYQQAGDPAASLRHAEILSSILESK